MRVMTPLSIPVFLGNAGIGLPHGMMPPQIRGFDVYYKFPIIVGFHILGNQEEICPAVDFMAQESQGENAPKIVGFYCIASGTHELPEPAFTASVAQEENSPQVLGFYAIAVSGAIIKDIGLLAQL